MKTIIIIVFLICLNLNLSLRKQKDNVNLNQNKNSYNNENKKTNKNPIKYNQEVSTLVEVPVSYSTGISYYYPYFYKARLISFTEDSNAFFNPVFVHLNRTCTEHCDVCKFKNEKLNNNLKNNTTITNTNVQCLKCSNGYYLNEGVCVEYCPDGKLADILRAKCLPKEMSQNIDIVYTMAYSVGSCRNMCGKLVQDCSCAPSCKSKGNCCTNYDVVNCDMIVDKALHINQNNCRDSGCELCDESEIKNQIFNNTTSNNTFTKSYKCTQCSEDRFLFEGTCVNSCPAGYIPNNINKVCNKNNLDCNSYIINCDQCLKSLNDENKIICRQCKRGTFLYNNECLETCPSGFRADRITWTCLEPPVFGWYWIYPTKESCKDKCNVNDSNNTKCSCNQDCVREGSCCPDFDVFCQSNK